MANQIEKLVLGGKFYVEHFRDGKLLDRYPLEWDKNLITNEGINHALDVVLSGGAANALWYVGLFKDNYAPTSGDTAAVPGFTEATEYDEATRPLWQEAGPSGQLITNSANKATFTMNAGLTVYGAFLKSTNVKGDTAGVLFASSKFSAQRLVAATDVLNIAYAVQGASA
jgi:hypothetical protein